MKGSGIPAASSEEFLAGGSAADSDRSNAVTPESLRPHVTAAADWARKASFPSRLSRRHSWNSQGLLMLSVSHAELSPKRYWQEVRSMVWGWRNIIGGSCHKYHKSRQNTSFVATKVCLSPQIFVATNIIL